MEIIEYVKNELKFAGYIKDTVDENDPFDSYGQSIADAVIELIETFEKQGHSEFSAKITAKLFDRLVKFKPLTPLTGEDDEWIKINDNKLQNKRCSAVFKNVLTGESIYKEGKVFSDDGERWFFRSDSSIPVEFPFTIPNEPERIMIEDEEFE